MCDVHNYIKQHDETLQEAVRPLVELLTVTPTATMREQIIEFAMALGIHAAYRRIERDTKFEKVEIVREQMMTNWAGIKGYK